MSWTVAPAPPGSAKGLPYPRFDRGRGRTALLVSLFALGAVGSVGLIWLTARAEESSVGAVALALLLATVPVPFLVAAYLWLDRYEPEPRRFIAAALLWGAVVAPAFALLVQAILSPWQDEVPFSVLLTVVAPLSEEFGKGLLCAIVLVRRRRFAGLLDGIIYAGLAGIGFAFTENVLYYSRAYAGTLIPDISGPVVAANVFAARGIMSPFAHPFFTTATGVGIAVAVLTQRRWLQVVAPLLGFAGAVGLHAAWNGSTLLWRGLGFLAVFAGFMVPLFALVGFLALRALRRQADVVRAALGDASRRGWVHPAEIHWLVHFGDRAAARRFATRVAGKQAGASLHTYQRAATEMALMHDRVLHGRAPADGVARVTAHLERMHSWRPFVIMPPLASVPLGAQPQPPPPLSASPDRAEPAARA